jgi:hypothetical protein
MCKPSRLAVHSVATACLALAALRRSKAPCLKVKIDINNEDQNSTRICPISGNAERIVTYNA